VNACARATDPHRDAVYRSEHAAMPDGGRRFTRFGQLESYVEQVVTGPWWERTFPDAPLEVDVLRRSRSATFSAAHVSDDGDSAAIWVRDGSWDLVTVVHELAHVAVGPSLGGDGAHGAVFSTALLRCWRELCGVAAYGALRSALDANGVPYQRDRLL
jgi:putative metallohydrolase (TIGR04338 family)